MEAQVVLLVQGVIRDLMAVWEAVLICRVPSVARPNIMEVVEDILASIINTPATFSGLTAL
jgi:hypothetical protein